MAKKSGNKTLIIIIFIIVIILIIGLLSYFIYKSLPKKKVDTSKKSGGEGEDKKPINEVKVLKDAYDNVVFEFNKDTIKPVSYPYLDEIVDVLNQAPEWELKVEGHTDNVGSATYNLSLSNRRANSVKSYLVSKGISGDRITAEGFGSEKPIADNSTEAGREKNRRVEFKIIKP